MADGDKALEKIGRDRDAQRGTVAALSRDIAAVKQREEAAVSGGKGKGKRGGGGSSGGLARLSEAKAAVSHARLFFSRLSSHVCHVWMCLVCMVQSQLLLFNPHCNRHHKPLEECCQERQPKHENQACAFSITSYSTMHVHRNKGVRVVAVQRMQTPRTSYPKLSE